ncbi:MAG: HAMP domain-containing histidine kinase [Deltaproteobacteria bacterium]|nr:HAMP domain-containing histidine kinase [Deltaproteobacteria bacterium]
MTAAALRQAHEAQRRKDEFLAMLGHELRNPLAPIVTALHLMKAREDGSRHRERDIIERQVMHMIRLVDDLLDVSRIVKGQLQLAKRDVDIREVVTHAVEMTMPLFEQHGHHLSVDLPPVAAIVDGDSSRLAQVVANLLVNAARYTPPGGRVDVMVTLFPAEIELAVRDNGRGIDAEDRERIFELFVRSDRDTPSRS